MMYSHLQVDNEVTRAHYVIMQSMMVSTNELHLLEVHSMNELHSLN